MGGYRVLYLVFLALPAASAQTAPADWKTVKDNKGHCQIAVPPEWISLGENTGAVSLRDPTNMMAVVTTQPGQEFKPLSEALVRSLEIPKDKLFENSAKRIFYQDRTSKGTEDANAYSASVPAKSGTCSCRVVFLPANSAEVAKKIALSLAPASPQNAVPSESR
jgi:hypothetical protein